MSVLNCDASLTDDRARLAHCTEPQWQRSTKVCLIRCMIVRLSCNYIVFFVTIAESAWGIAGIAFMSFSTKYLSKLSALGCQQTVSGFMVGVSASGSPIAKLPNQILISACHGAVHAVLGQKYLYRLNIQYSISLENKHGHCTNTYSVYTMLNKWCTIHTSFAFLSQISQTHRVKCDRSFLGAQRSLYILSCWASSMACL